MTDNTRSHKSADDSVNRLTSTVIENGFCVGCGVCAGWIQAPFRVTMDAFGRYQAQINRLGGDPAVGDIQAVCPFSDHAECEETIARGLFRGHCRSYPNVGHILKSYVGYVIENDIREKGSSGGFGTWVLKELFRRNRIDFAIHVQPRTVLSPGEVLFSYGISKEVESIRRGAKSRYYPIELSSVLKEVRQRPGRYAVVGLPCFIKAIRLLQIHDPLIKARIRYCIGLVCGHLKSTRYAESLAWQMGIPPWELREVDFRVKDPTRPANQYSTSARDGIGEKTCKTSELFGTDWGAGILKYKACDFCDDVFAETADVVVGDAWLPRYAKDPAGTNILIIREPDIGRIFEEGLRQGRIWAVESTPRELISSQLSGLLHRRDAIAYRLASHEVTGKWTPKKRIKPSHILFLGFERRRQDLRTELREVSHKAFSQALNQRDLRIFFETLGPLYQEYRSVSGSIWERLASLVRRRLRRIY